jgi:predicted Na+-dependent transporter
MSLYLESTSQDASHSPLPEVAFEEEDTNTTMSLGDYLLVIVPNVLLFFLIFGLSATVDVKSLQRQWRNKFAIGTGVAMQFGIMPLLGFIAVMVLRSHGLTSAMCITLLVLTSSPGGSYSNWWCSTFNADLALSVTMTSISSLVSVVMLPANLFLFSYLAYDVFPQDMNTTNAHSEGIVHALDFKSIFFTLAVVLGAILSGLSAGYKWDTPAFHVFANRVGSIMGVLLISFSLCLSFSGSDDSDGTNNNDNEKSQSLWSYNWAFYLGVAFPCVGGMILANVISRTCFKLSKPECVTLSIECCYQNIGIATGVAVTMFQDNPTERAQAIAVPLFYASVEAVAIGIYCLWAWKAGWTKAPANEKFWVVVTKTYEVDDFDETDAAGAAGGDDDAEEENEELTELGLWSAHGGGGSSSCVVKDGNRKRLVSEDTTVTCSTMASFASYATPERKDDASVGMVALDEESYCLDSSCEDNSHRGEDGDSTEQRFVEDTA